jgi:hypothetical protein
VHISAPAGFLSPLTSTDPHGADACVLPYTARCFASTWGLSAMRLIMGAAVMLAAMTLSACETLSVTEPVAVVSGGIPGGMLRGTSTASADGTGTFSVSNDKITCGGSYNSLDQSVTITMPVLCSDGRKGVVIDTRDASGVSGGGTVQLNDGTTGSFIFGAAATKLYSNVAIQDSDQPAAVPSYNYPPATPAIEPACSETGSCYGDISTTTGLPRDTYVRGYTRANGTYVGSYYRSK